ncbi:P-loop NTPase fold protein [Rufibacter sediminis]|uniref:KAP NTPase domain-containing protein n=1 Tax=Rufibacter sediminis TaxID=2762756 RepID=A0ABR6VY37_9BACT|nr:P-loop NTPase fold protein [Rufibacter sediminis]MBC3542110.1 hypothetical protein [Rufibacter sediminis]
MSRISKLASKIINGQTLTILATIAGLSVFHTPVEKLLSDTVVKHLLTYCESNWFNDVIFILAAVALILLTYRKRKRIIANNSILILLAISAFYLYHRIFKSTWELTGFQTIPNIKYADFILLYTALTILNWSRQFQKRQVEKTSLTTFFDDEPLSDKKEDKLGYSIYAKTVADKIEAYNHNKSFAIGVNGKWGMGKTSFFDLIKRELNKEENIIIDFNAWNNSSPRAIIQDFFNTLQEALNPYYSSLAHQLAIYSDKLVTVNDNSITQSLKVVLGLFTSDSSLSSIHDQINQKLIKIDKKIIIFIDDLDRLDKHEIIEVFRLVRNTANFQKTIFLAAYDRDYALKAISEYNPHNYELFLEKIFQLEINLPYFEPAILKNRLIFNLKHLLPTSLHHSIESTISNKNHRDDINLLDWISSIRDVTRVTNTIAVTMEGLHGEIYFRDFFYLQLLRMKYASVFEHLSKNYHAYLQSNNHSYGNNRYFLKQVDRRTNNSSKHYILDEYLSNNKSYFSIHDNDIEKIIKLLVIIFDKHARDWDNKQDHLSVVFPLHRNKYFMYNLNEGNISEVSFTKARASSQEEFNRLISHYVNEGLQLELRYRFMNIKDFQSREDFERVIKGIFHFANLKSQPPYNSYSSIVGYDVDDLRNKLSDYNQELSRNYYNSANSEILYKTFFRELFQNAKYPYLFESRLIGDWLKGSIDNFPISRDELRDYAISYFAEYCSRALNLNEYVWEMLYDCQLQESEKAPNTSIIPKRAKDIFLDFLIEKDIDGVIVDIIQPDRRNEAKYSLSGYVIGIWESWDEFIEFLTDNRNNNWKYIDEFIEFYTAASEKGFENSIEFNFKTIPVKK